MDNKKSITLIPLNNFRSGIEKYRAYSLYLLIMQNENGKPIAANLVFYTHNLSKRTLTASTVKAVNELETVSEDGNYAFKSIFDKFIFERKYRNGVLNEFSEQRPNYRSDAVQSRNGQYCVNWYLVTTTYYPDGHYEVTSEFLYMTCSDCPPTEICDEAGSGGGGGGAPGTIEEYAVSREEEWTVKQISIITYVWSVERIKGKRNSSEPQGGHFTGLVHLGTGVTSSNYNWVKTGQSGAATNQTASSQVIGHYTPPNSSPIGVNNTKTWSFASVFP